MTPPSSPLIRPFCAGPDWKPRRAVNQPGTCGACGKPLEGRALWFCRTPRGAEESCRLAYLANHDWGAAKREARKRAGNACSVDGPHAGGLEVNHITPRNGRGYQLGCHHHQDGLNVLCHLHHLAVTATQRAGHHKAPDKAGTQLPLFS